MLREVAREAADLGAELAERLPAWRAELRSRAREVLDLLRDAPRVSLREAGEPLEFGRRQAERLANVADGAARVVRGEAGHEGRVLRAVLLDHGDDELLADVAREVQVDVGHGDELAVEEAAEGEPGGDGVDVGEPGQIADERADRAPASPSRREEVAGRAGAADLERDLARELEHLPVEKEEAGEAELGDERQLLAQARIRAGAQSDGRVAVALFEGMPADAGELDVGRIGAVGEVRIPVAELLGEVELEPLGELGGGAHRIPVVGKARGGFPGWKEDAFLVPAPLRFAALERNFVFHRYKHVLQVKAAGMVRVDVAGGDRADSELAGEVAERGVAARIAAGVRALELDEEAVAAEGAREPGGRVGVHDGEAVAGAAGEADESLVVLGEEVGVEARIEALVRVSGGEQAAQVGVAAGGLDEERHVGAVGERHLGTGERLDAHGLGRVCELERAVDPVVVGERERRVAELGGADGELFGQRSAVEEGVGGVRVELDVRHGLGTLRVSRARFAAVRSTRVEARGGPGPKWHSSASWRRSSADRARASS
jgi:hypothetical protein